jgi:hypothetical protein
VGAVERIVFRKETTTPAGIRFRNALGGHALRPMIIRTIHFLVEKEPAGKAKTGQV